MGKAKEQKRCRASLTVELPNGEKKRLFFDGKTEKEANEKREEAKLLCKMGLLTFNSNTPLRRWAEEYFDIYVRPSCAEAAAEQLWDLLEKTLLNDYGHVSLSDIKPTMAQNGLNKVKQQSKSQNDKAYMVIKGLFEKAKMNGMITKNPMEGISKEKKKSGSNRALTDHEREMFIRTLPKHEKGILFALMFYCGLRPGEARAMTWNNIDMVNKTLSVTHAVKKSTTKTNTGIIVGAPKTDSSTRIVPMPDILVEMFRPIYQKSFSYVVPGKDGKPISEQCYHRARDSFFRQMQIEAGAKLYRNAITVYAEGIGLDLQPYCLRHTYATRLAEKNVPIKVAIKLMGHTTPNMLMQIYQHVSEQMEESAKLTIANLYDDTKTTKANEA